MIAYLASSAEEVALSKELAQISLALPNLLLAEGFAILCYIVLIHLQERCLRQSGAVEPKESVQELPLVDAQLVDDLSIDHVVPRDASAILLDLVKVGQRWQLGELADGQYAAGMACSPRGVDREEAKSSIML